MEKTENENDFKKFRDALLNGLKHKPSEWRDGQYIFNYINEYYGVARDVQYIDGIDCFHDDSKIDEFIEACYKRLV